MNSRSTVFSQASLLFENFGVLSEAVAGRKVAKSYRD
jgi:hypothetical protein